MTANFRLIQGIYLLETLSESSKYIEIIVNDVICGYLQYWTMSTNFQII